MEMTTRSLWTLIHGMRFGAPYLLAGSGAIACSGQYSIDSRGLYRKAAQTRGE
jgi:hypothetical protein